MPVRSLKELTEDPHLRATGFFSESEHPSEGPVLTFASPLNFEKTKTPFRRHTPRVGEDGVEVLQEAAQRRTDRGVEGERRARAALIFTR